MSSAGKLCVVCFTTPNQRFLHGIRRIEETLKNLDFQGDFLHWHRPHGNFPEDCPSHLDSPWGFKPWALQAAYAKGYRFVLWLDSSVLPVDIDSIFEHIAAQGSYFVRRRQQARCNRMVAQVCSDAALNAMGVDRETAMDIPQISAQRIGLDLQDPTSLKFLEEWHGASMDGVSFKGYPGVGNKEDYLRVYENTDGFASSDPRVLGHRHDQTIASILVERLQIPWEIERDEEAIIDKSFVHQRDSAFI